MTRARPHRAAAVAIGAPRELTFPVTIPAAEAVRARIGQLMTFLALGYPAPVFLVPTGPIAIAPERIARERAYREREPAYRGRIDLVEGFREPGDRMPIALVPASPVRIGPVPIAPTKASPEWIAPDVILPAAAFPAAVGLGSTARVREHRVPIGLNVIRAARDVRVPMRRDATRCRRA